MPNKQFLGYRKGVNGLSEIVADIDQTEWDLELFFGMIRNCIMMNTTAVMPDHDPQQHSGREGGQRTQPGRMRRTIEPSHICKQARQTRFCWQQIFDS